MNEKEKYRQDEINLTSKVLFSATNDGTVMKCKEKRINRPSPATLSLIRHFLKDKDARTTARKELPEETAVVRGIE